MVAQNVYQTWGTTNEKALDLLDLARLLITSLATDTFRFHVI